MNGKDKEAMDGNPQSPQQEASGKEIFAQVMKLEVRVAEVAGLLGMMSQSDLCFRQNDPAYMKRGLGALAWGMGMDLRDAFAELHLAMQKAGLIGGGLEECAEEDGNECGRRRGDFD